MKILKPGKVEQRKFACPRCGCIFVVSRGENVIRQGSRYPDTAVIACPEQGCKGGIVVWAEGEPYEEQMQDAKEYIYGILLTAKPQVTTEELAEYLVAHGVTFWEG